jgi:hypothetical protein
METQGDIGPLVDELQQGTIYRFAYSFRGGLEPDQAFLLANAEGKVFCAIGKPAKVEFLGLAQAAAAVEDEETESEEDEGAIDFSMM